MQASINPTGVSGVTGITETEVCFINANTVSSAVFANADIDSIFV